MRHISKLIIMMALGAFVAISYNERALAGASGPDLSDQIQPRAAISAVQDAVQNQRYSNVPIQLPGLARTCLPVEGRMLRDRSAACHCPPESLCPTDMNEWIAARTLPPRIAGVCCDIPFQCTVEYTTQSGSGNTRCGNRLENQPRFAQICTQYNAKVVDGSQAKDDPDYDADLAANVEMELREKAANRYNTCFANQCAARESDIDSVNGLNEFVSCELRCRQRAANVLQVNLTSQERRLGEVTGDMAGGVNADRLFADLNSTSYNFNATPSSQFPASALDDKLQCGDVTAPAICMAHNRLDECDNGGDNSSGDSDCVAKGTGILLADGSTKAIQELKVGDKLRSANGATAIVAELYERNLEAMAMYSINNGALEITVEHPIKTKDGWRAVDYTKASAETAEAYGLKEVPQLQVGDVIITADGEVKVEAMFELPAQAEMKTYNLRLEGGDSFYANGILVKSN